MKFQKPIRGGKIKWTANLLISIATLNTPILTALAEPPRYKIIDLTTIAEDIGVIQSEARSINEAGSIVGFEALGDFKERSILWEPDGTVQFLTRLEGDNSDLAFSIADNGTIIGVSENVWIEDNGHQQRIYEEQKATVWVNHQIANLNELVTSGDTYVDLRIALDIDNTDRIIGYGRSFGKPPYTSYGFLFDNGEVTDLGELQRAYAINNNLQIVGWGGGQAHAFLWDNGVITNLHDHKNIHGVTSRAFDVNDAGMIVGEAQFEISRPEEPTLWLNGEPIRLVPDFERPQGWADGINTRGQIVGSYNNLDDINDPWHAFIWENGEWTDLLTQLVENDGWEIIHPFDINDRGQIVGGGYHNARWGRAFLMTPVYTAFHVGLEVVTGQLLDGDVNDLYDSDDSYVHTRSGFGETFAELHVMEMRIIGVVDGLDEAIQMDIKIESRINHTSGLAKISFRNWNTMQFETVANYPISDIEETVTLESIEASNYIRNANATEYEMQIKHVVFVPFLAFTFESFVDWVEIVVE